MDTNETASVEATQDPQGMSTQAFLETLEQQSGTEEKTETQAPEEAPEQEPEEEKADGSEEEEPEDDVSDPDEITDTSDLALDAVVDALKDNPKALTRYMEQAKGFEKLREQVTDLKPKSEEYDQWLTVLQTEQHAPLAVRNLVRMVCDTHDFDEADFLRWLGDNEPAMTGKPAATRAVDPEKSALEDRLARLEAREQERIQQSETEKFVAEQAPKVAKTIAREYNGFAVTPAMVREAIKAHPELRTKPTEAVEFHYRKDLIKHSSQKRSDASEVKGHVVPQSHKGVGRKVENVDPRTMTTEQWLARNVAD